MIHQNTHEPRFGLAHAREVETCFRERFLYGVLCVGWAEQPHRDAHASLGRHLREPIQGYFASRNLLARKFAHRRFPRHAPDTDTRNQQSDDKVTIACEYRGLRLWPRRWFRAAAPAFPKCRNRRWKGVCFA